LSKSESLSFLNYPKGKASANRCLLTIILSFIVGFPYAQSLPKIDLFSSEHGLSQSVVNCIHQDRDGFLWIGTQDGLNMFDGQKFTVYQNNPSDSSSISNNYILCICEDELGYLWVGTMAGGLNRFDKRKGRFLRFINDPQNLNCIPDNSIWTVLADSSGFIFAGTSKGLCRISIQSHEIKNFRSNTANQNSIASEAVFSSHTDINGEIWLGTPMGLSKYNKNTGAFNNYQFKGEDSKPLVWSFYEGTDQFYIGTNKGLWLFDQNSLSYKKINVPGLDEKAVIWSIIKDAKNRIWLGTDNGIHSYSETDPEYCFTWLEDVEGLNNVWDIITDQSGLIWAGSDKGLLKINHKGSHFYNITAETGQPCQLSLSSVTAIFEDSRKQLWIGTEGGGLNFFDEKRGVHKVYRSDGSGNGSISGNRIWSMIEGSDGLIWIGTYGDGLNAFNPETGSFETFRVKENSKNSISNNRVLVLMEDKKGYLWIGTRGGGLNRFDKKTREFKIYKTADSGNVIPSNTILSLKEDEKGMIWIGTFEGGLSILDPVKETFTNFRNEAVRKNSLSNNSIWSIHFDNQSRVWLGTQAGLNYTKIDSLSEFKLLTQVHGLKSNVIFNLQEDDKGNLWMSTFKGIARLNRNQFNKCSNQDDFPNQYIANQFNPLFSNFDITDGLISNEFNQCAGFKSNDGRIYFGSFHGLCYFHPDSIKASEFHPKIKLTQFKIFNKETKILEERPKDTFNIIDENGFYYLPQRISFMNELHLTYKESVISFEFAALDFTHPEKNQFAFMMEGFENDWNYVSNQRMATYTNLDAGNYIFKVKGTNADGIWSNHEANLKIHIQPPFWKTSWFMASVSLLILFIAYFIIRRIFQQQKQKAIQEKEKMELQLKTIKNQIDPHFAFNAMNMMGSLVYKNDPDAVYDYFTRFAQLIRSTLQDSERISRTIQEELVFVTNYIEIQKTRFKNKFDYAIKLDPQINQGFEIPKMIIQTHSENAIKHGIMHKKEKGFLSIELSQAETDTLLISIADDGVGRIAASEISKGGTKKGMKIIDQIFNIYNKLFKYNIDQQIIDLVNKDGKPAGTQVLITISKNGKQ
jgi:ligand-binding sensor domain-containing protein/uncharacterized membrane-anchored protein YhcB (DUF1043 family)